MDRILITGCGGMLGEAVYRVCRDGTTAILATDIDLNEPWLKYLDVRDFSQCEKVIGDFRPTVIFHLAAMTDLELCENKPSDAFATNATGSENIALLAERFGSVLVYISTAGVFDGTKDVYTDFDLPNPINNYGKSKYYGEQFITGHMSKYFIFRAGWMMGGGLQKDKKFISKIFKQVYTGARELFIVDDKLGTPTYTYDFAHNIMKVLPTRRYGVYNQVCNGLTDRLQVASEFVRLLGMAGIVQITSVSSDYFSQEYFAKRPRSEMLVNLKLDLNNLNFMRHWRECLGEYSEIFKSELKLKH